MSETDADKIEKAAIEDVRGGTWTGDWSPITLEHVESASRCGFIRGARWARANLPAPMEAKEAAERHAAEFLINPLFAVNADHERIQQEIRDVIGGHFLRGDANGAYRERIKVVEEICEWLEENDRIGYDSFQYADQIRKRFGGNHERG